MAENVWVLNDSTPSSVAQQFAAVPAAASWTINDSTPTGMAMTFQAPAVPWTLTYGGSPCSMLFDNWAAPPIATARMRTMMGAGT